MLDVNLTGPFLLIKHAARRMGTGGSIVVTASAYTIGFDINTAVMWGLSIGVGTRKAKELRGRAPELGLHTSEILGELGREADGVTR